MDASAVEEEEMAFLREKRSRIKKRMEDRRRLLTSLDSLDSMVNPAVLHIHPACSNSVGGDATLKNSGSSSRLVAENFGFKEEKSGNEGKKRFKPSDQLNSAFGVKRDGVGAREAESPRVHVGKDPITYVHSGSIRSKNFSRTESESESNTGDKACAVGSDVKSETEVQNEASFSHSQINKSTYCAFLKNVIITYLSEEAVSLPFTAKDLLSHILKSEIFVKNKIFNSQNIKLEISVLIDILLSMSSDHSNIVLVEEVLLDNKKEIAIVGLDKQKLSDILEEEMIQGNKNANGIKTHASMVPSSQLHPQTRPLCSSSFTGSHSDISNLAEGNKNAGDQAFDMNVTQLAESELPQESYLEKSNSGENDVECKGSQMIVDSHVSRSKSSKNPKDSESDLYGMLKPKPDVPIASSSRPSLTNQDSDFKNATKLSLATDTGEKKMKKIDLESDTVSDKDSIVLKESNPSTSMEKSISKPVDFRVKQPLGLSTRSGMKSGAFTGMGHGMSISPEKESSSNGNIIGRPGMGSGMGQASVPGMTSEMRPNMGSAILPEMRPGIGFNPAFGPPYSPGFNPGFGPGFGPAFGMGFNPGFGPGFCPGMGPPQGPGFGMHGARPFFPHGYYMRGPPGIMEGSGSGAASGDNEDEDMKTLQELLSKKSVKEMEKSKTGEELLHLLHRPTAKETAVANKFKTKGGFALKEYCTFLTFEDCMRNLPPYTVCSKVHFRRIIAPHTDITLGDCSFLDTCRHMKTCKYVHYELDSSSHMPSPLGGLMPRSMPTKKRAEYCSDAELGEAQWINCDIRNFKMDVLGQFGVIMADPPWDIHMELPYGTMSDEEMKCLNVPALQTDGLIFLWVTGRAMELGRECLELWGYKRVEEIIWVKTNQLQRIIRTGRTGHWLNHSKEHCLVGIKGNPLLNRNIDTDVIVAEVRQTSRKPDEMYPLIERISPRTRKLELFARMHNTHAGWISLGNQLEGVRIVDSEMRARFKAAYPGVPIQPADISQTKPSASDRHLA